MHRLTLIKTVSNFVLTPPPYFFPRNLFTLYISNAWNRKKLRTEKNRISRMPNTGFAGSNVMIVWGILTPQHDASCVWGWAPPIQPTSLCPSDEREEAVNEAKHWPQWSWMEKIHFFSLNRKEQVAGVHLEYCIAYGCEMGGPFHRDECAVVEIELADLPREQIHLLLKQKKTCQSC